MFFGRRACHHKLPGATARRPLPHGTARACFGERGLELLMNRRLLVFIFDLRTAFFDAFARFAVVKHDGKLVPPAAAFAQRQVARRTAARVKMLVKPLPPPPDAPP